MAQKLNSKEIVSLEELVYSNSMQLEALLRLLVKEGIISKDKLMEEYKQLLKETQEKQGNLCNNISLRKSFTRSYDKRSRERDKEITIKVLQGKIFSKVAKEYCLSIARISHIFWRTVRFSNI